MPRGLAFRNRPLDDQGIGVEHPPEELVKQAFARKLSELLRTNGWNQSELARQASLHMPEGGKFNRDNVSNYVRGRHLPGPVHLDALCKALHVKLDELLPPGSTPSAEDRLPLLDVRDLGDGTVYLRLNQQMPWEKALKILNVAKGE